MKKLLVVLVLISVCVATSSSIVSAKEDIKRCTTYSGNTCINTECTILSYYSNTICSDGTGFGSNGTVEVPSGYFLGNTEQVETCVEENCCTITVFLSKEGEEEGKISSECFLQDFNFMYP